MAGSKTYLLLSCSDEIILVNVEASKMIVSLYGFYEGKIHDGTLSSPYPLALQRVCTIDL